MRWHATPAAWAGVQGRALMAPYLPRDGGSTGSAYSEGGALYALGLIHANHGQPIMEFLLQMLRSTANEVRMPCRAPTCGSFAALFWIACCSCCKPGTGGAGSAIAGYFAQLTGKEKAAEAVLMPPAFLLHRNPALHVRRS